MRASSLSKQNRQAVFQATRMAVRLSRPTREDEITRNLFLTLARIFEHSVAADESRVRNVRAGRRQPGLAVWKLAR